MECGKTLYISFFALSLPETAIHKLYKQIKMQSCGDEMEAVSAIKLEEVVSEKITETALKADVKKEVVSEKKDETAKAIQKPAAKKDEHPTHNSLQHDPTISVPLLSILIDALKKEVEEDSLETKTEGVEVVEEESDTKKKKDPVLALAEKIKQMYAQELVQQSYAQTALQSYKSASEGYHQAGSVTVQQKEKPSYEMQEESFEKKKSDIHARIKEENSKAYKLNRDSRYQANVMSDPRGRLVSTWTYVRSLNETADGKISANDGYISQGF